MANKVVTKEMLAARKQELEELEELRREMRSYARAQKILAMITALGFAFLVAGIVLLLTSW